MKEEDVAQQLHSYREALGICQRRPVAPKSPRAVLLLAPAAVVALGAIAVIAWPRDASASALRRFDLAILNAKSMESHMFLQDPKGKWAEWQQQDYEARKWRMETFVPAGGGETVIFRDGLCIEDFKKLDHATLRPIASVRMPIPDQGAALEIVKAEMRLASGRASTLAIQPARDIDGKPAYRVVFRRKDGKSHAEILVDKATDLPISADYWNQDPVQHARWTYRFNVGLPNGLFDLKPGRQVFDLRKTLPAQEAAWGKPLVSRAEFAILDACATRDGTVWVSTKFKPSKGIDTSPDMFHGLKGVAYATGSSLVTGLTRPDELVVYRFVPLDPVKGPLRRASVTFNEYTRPLEISPDSDTMSAGMALKAHADATFPVRTEKAVIPPFLNKLGFDNDLVQLSSSDDFFKAMALAGLGRTLEGARIYERMGKTSSPLVNNSDVWYRHAVDLYLKANDPKDAKRLVKLIAANSKKN